MEKVDLFSVTFNLCSPLSHQVEVANKNNTSIYTWLQQQGFPIPPERTPSLAAQHLHSLSRARSISVRLRRVDVEPHVLFATIALDGELKDCPRCVLDGSEASLQVLSHYFRQSECCGDILICNEVPNCGYTCCKDGCAPSAVVKRKEYHLDHVFSDCSAAEENDAVRETNTIMNVVSSIGPNDQLSRLPHDVQLRIISHLAVADVHSLQATSRLFRAATKYFVPGLNVRLYPHQRAALNRMRRMEGGAEKFRTMPMLRAVQPLALYPFSVCPLKVFADLCDGSLYIHSHVPSVPVPRGGILADEPGLGKTVTGIALILKSLDQRSSPPGKERKKSYRHVREPVKKRRRTSKIAVEMASSHIPEPVIVNYYEEVTVGDDNLNDSIPGRRMRILCSKSKETPPHPALQYMQVNTEHLRKGGMVTRRKARLGHQEPTIHRLDVLLTGCTLILCPKPLVPHWVSQIQERTSNRLRVLAIRKCSQLPSKEVLALDYDVIVLSFTVVQWLNEKMKRELPSIFQVRFLRILYDEGHEMGGRTEHNSVFQMINMLKAERKWILTGTPTPSNPYSDVRFLRPLLRFIREPTYGMDVETWVRLIQRPYGLFRPESLDRLKLLLREIMIRSEKQTISSIPDCNVSNVFLEFPKQSAMSYNELVMAATRNIVTSDWFSEIHKESLLNESNRGLRMELVNNLRQSCVFGGGFTRVDVHIPDLIEALDTLYSTRARGHGALRYIGVDAAEPYQPNTRRGGLRLGSKVYRGRLKIIANGFLRGGECECCSSLTRVPYVTPCAHMICNTCLLTDRTGCPVKSCGTKYSLDANLVPEEFIELQPSMVLGQWKSQDSTKSVKMDYIMNKLENIEYNHDVVDGKPVCRRRKVIVYSQFDDHLMRVAINLKNHPQLKKCYTELYPNRRDYNRVLNVDQFIEQELTEFRNNDEKFVLLLGKKYGSVGLDLSYVEHIYLLEPFWDSALEKQVISRAHRLGAKAPINVERILIKGTIEEDAILHEESLRQECNELSTVKEISKEQQNRRGRDVLLRMTPVQYEKSSVIGSPVTPLPNLKRSFPILEGYTTSKELAVKTGKKRAHELDMAAKKRKVRRKLW